MDSAILAPLGQFTPEKALLSGYGDEYLFFVGRDDVHGVIKYLLSNEQLFIKVSMYAYDDKEFNSIIMTKLQSKTVRVQITLDASQSTQQYASEPAILAANKAQDPVDWGNAVVIGNTQSGQIIHTKGGVLLGQGVLFEGSTNWSASGEGAGLVPGSGKQVRAQSNTLMVSTNPVSVARFSANLDYEHAHVTKTVTEQPKKVYE